MWNVRFFIKAQQKKKSELTVRKVISKSKRAKPFFNTYSHAQWLSAFRAVCIRVCVFVRERAGTSFVFLLLHIVKATLLLYEALNLSEVPDHSFQLHQTLISSVFHSTAFAPLDHKDSRSRCSYDMFLPFALWNNHKPYHEMLIHCMRLKPWAPLSI